MHLMTSYRIPLRIKYYWTDNSVQSYFFFSTLAGVLTGLTGTPVSILYDGISVVRCITLREILGETHYCLTLANTSRSPLNMVPLVNAPRCG